MDASNIGMRAVSIKKKKRWLDFNTVSIKRVYAYRDSIWLKENVV